MARQINEPVDQVSVEEVEIVIGEDPIEEVQQSENLAEDIDDEDLDEIASDLVSAYESDLQSRGDWEDTIKKGMDLLGLKLEEIENPFPGACSAHHPLMIEAAVQFHAQALKELFPSNGPVKTQIIGEKTKDIESQAERVKDFMNYQVTEQMEEYFDDLDQMLFYLPIVGSCFKKVYYDSELERPVAKFIPVTDFVVSTNTTDLRTSGRYTHVIRMEGNELKKRQVSGFYRDIELMEEDKSSESTSMTGINEKIQSIEGVKPSNTYTKDARFTLLEMHVDLELPKSKKEFACPYIVTICKETNDILSIRQNFRDEDPKFKRLQYFVHYKFLPGFNFYGLGYVHLLGNLQKTSTTILRSLVDAGQFANLPGGFKARGMRVDGDQPVGFGEFRDVEGYGDDIRKSIVPLPFKEPSQVLTALLGSITQEGRRLAAITDLQTGDMNSQAPVGTTIALLEQGIKVMSSIHKRLHKAQREEFKILARTNHDFLPSDYPYAVEGVSRQIFKQDFDGTIDVLPVSDPNIFSTAQRVLMAQTQIQAATQAPQIHDLREAYRRLYKALDVENVDEMLIPEMGSKPMDPATENYTMMYQKPVKAYGWQDHDAHISVHEAFMSDPSVIPQDPRMQQALAGALQAHIQEHQAHKYRMAIMANANIELPNAPEYDRFNPGKDNEYESMDRDIENAVAQAQAQVSGQIAQANQMQAQQQQQQQQAQDPRFQLAQQDLQLRAQENQRKAEEGAARTQLKAQEVQLKEEQAASKAQLDASKLALDRDKTMADMEIDREKLRSNEERDIARAEYQKEMVDSKSDIERAKTIIEREQREKDREASKD